MHSKPFFSNHTNAIQAKKELFNRFKVQVLVNLSKLRREKLFPKSEAPALIIIAQGKISKHDDICYFVCPDRSSNYKEHGIIEIGVENIKKLSVFDIAHDSDILKVATWGSARDQCLIKKLQYNTLSIEKITKNSYTTGFRHWYRLSKSAKTDSVGLRGNEKIIED